MKRLDVLVLTLNTLAKLQISHYGKEKRSGI